MARFPLHLVSPSSEAEGQEEDEEEDFPVSSPLIGPAAAEEERNGDSDGHVGGGGGGGEGQFSIVSALVAALRKSLVLCSVGAEEDGAAGMEIGWPSEVRHVAHVTFDRFDGFLGLPQELEPEVPPKAPSASVSVFGVSAKSMQCSYDGRGNSVPTVLLLLQRHLYAQGGLQAEGIFRINAENSQEAYVRDQLNRGILPYGIDKYCLAGLIKAWFRELPTGVLDSLTPDQVMHCNTEEECAQLVQMLPPTEAALLDWAINLMADVVEHEHYNKMNARNVAMVFAPNMTQMADPLTALIHAVQVMNFLKTLITKMLREREEAAAAARMYHSCTQSPTDQDETQIMKRSEKASVVSDEITQDLCVKTALSKFLLSAKHVQDCNVKESFRSFEKKSVVGEDRVFLSGNSSPINSCDSDSFEDGSKARFENGDVEGFLDGLNLPKGVRKLCMHPVFQFSRSIKKSGELGIVNPREEGREAWA